MNTHPILTVKDSFTLELEFPGWSRAMLDATRENLICWKLRRGSENKLWAPPLVLAMWEARETYPKLQVSKEDRERLRFLALDRTEVNPGTPVFKSLKPVQVEPTGKLWKRNRAILTAAPGLGKTVMALVALSQRHVDLLVVIVPLTSFDGWAEEIDRWLVPSLPPHEFWKWRERSQVQPIEDRDKPLIVLTTPSVITGITDMRSEYGEGLGSVFMDASDLDSFLILDESFLYQNRKSGRTEDMTELACNFANIWMLSGMPISTANDDLFSQLKMLYPKVFSSYWKFARRYCLIETNFWGTKIVGNKLDSEELLRRDLADIVISCEYPENVPGWIVRSEPCPMTARQEEIYLSAKELLAVDAKTLGSEKPLGIKKLIALTTRLLQIASNPLTLEGVDESGKWERLMELLGSGPQPALIWVKYRITAKAIARKIGYRYPLYRVASVTGMTKPSERYKHVTSFQEGKLDVLILNDSVGKYSLTLTAAKVAYYLERNFDGEAYYQSLYRARRITSPHPVAIVHLLSTYGSGGPTIDQVVHDTLLDRSQNAQRLTIGQLIGSC